LLGRFIVKLRLILSPHAELSRTSSTFSALTALFLLLLWPDDMPLTSTVSKLYPEFDGCGDSVGDTADDMDGKAVLIDTSVPRRWRNGAPSSPYVMNELRVSVISVGDNRGEAADFLCLFNVSSSST
jgi:hypothetical protein